MAPGSTPLSSSHTHASVAVLPDPAMTYSDGAPPKLTRSLTVTACTPSETPNGGGVVAGICRGKVASVDRAPPTAHLVTLPGQARDEPTLAEVVAIGVEGNLGGPDQALAQHPDVVPTDLRRRRPLVQAGFGPVLLDPIGTEPRRRHAIERRGLVQPHEGVRVQPVPADVVAAVDHDHTDLRVVDQSVRKRHPCGTPAAPAHHVFVGLPALAGARPPTTRAMWRSGGLAATLRAPHPPRA